MVLTAAVLAQLLAGLPAEGRQAAGRATPTRLSPEPLAGSPVKARQAGPGRSGGWSIGPGAPGYVPPVIHEERAVRVHLVGLLHTGKEDPGRQFSARNVRDLLIAVEYRDLTPGRHTQRLKLFAPDGALYQQLTTAVATNPPARGKGLRGPGWERVTTRLPVGGTWITEHGLYGTWRLEVYMDTGRDAATTTTFVLKK
jgi:hypothetical protein